MSDMSRQELMDMQQDTADCALKHKTNNRYELIEGYVVNEGGPNSLTTYAPIFGVSKQPGNHIWKVLCETVGEGTLWFNYNRMDVHIDRKDKEIGIKLFKVLEEIRK